MTKQKKKAPVSIGDQIELQIVGLNHQGEGVGRFHSFTIFVPDTVPNDQVIARVISLQKNYARALPEKILKPSPFRIAPFCQHYGACGGCQLQHLAYQQQLQFKQNLVADTLKRIAQIEIPVHPTIGMANPWQYRNKAQVPVGVEAGIVQAGFYEKRSHKIVNLASCPIQHSANDETVKVVRQILQEMGISIYSEANHTGFVRQIMTRTSFATGDILLVLVTNGRRFPQADNFVQHAREKIKNLTGIVQNINTKRGNTILGPEEVTLWGNHYITEKIGLLQFKVSSRSFFQVNPLQTEKLYAKTKEYAALTGQETVFDLYCGIGTIALYLAAQAAKVIGVEIVEAAVKDARENAKLNHINNAEFHTGAAEAVVPKLLQQGYRADVVVVDPPRKGCDKTLLKTITIMQPKRIVYVSCNPATLARDLKYLNENGYKALEAQPVDMFPQTSHVECIALIQREIS